jgi:hypothetical protein
MEPRGSRIADVSSVAASISVTTGEAASTENASDRVFAR